MQLRFWFESFTVQGNITEYAIIAQWIIDPYQLSCKGRDSIVCELKSVQFLSHDNCNCVLLKECLKFPEKAAAYYNKMFRVFQQKKWYRKVLHHIAVIPKMYIWQLARNEYN